MPRQDRTSKSPTLAEAFESLRSDYNAAKSSRFRRYRAGVSAIGRTGDYHYRTEADHLRMMELSRDFFRNNAIVSQGVRRLVHNVIRDGFHYDPQTGSAELDRQLAQRWADWSGDPQQCDIQGEHTFHDLEKLTLQSVVVDGDIVYLMLRIGALQGIEAHRLRTPRSTKQNVVHGVLLDENRRRREYWITKDDIDPNRAVQKVNQIVKYPARDPSGNRLVLHIYRRDRMTQTRGVTHLAPVCDITGMHDDVVFAKLVQAQVTSAFSILRELPEGWSGARATQIGSQSTETRDDGTTRTLEGVGPGMMYTGRPGERLHGFSPNVPNPEFFPFSTLLLTFIAVNLNLPVAVLLLDPTQTNFSGWRGAIDQARMSFQDLQRWLVDSFHRPVLAWKIRQWLATDGELALLAEQEGVNPHAHRWNRPSWPYIEPLKDRSAELLAVRNALTSHRRRCAERGVDWGDLSTEIVEDNAEIIRKAHEKARELNAALPGLTVTWRELAMLPTPDGLSLTLDVDADQQNQQQNQRE